VDDRLHVLLRREASGELHVEPLAAAQLEPLDVDVAVEGHARSERGRIERQRGGSAATLVGAPHEIVGRDVDPTAQVRPRAVQLGVDGRAPVAVAVGRPQ
jgi:hypothetical protein